jgi:hypothetical protein
MHHFKDPCIHCGTRMEDMDPGPCKGDAEKVIPIAFRSVEVRPDGVEHYRVLMSDGEIKEMHSHISNHLPYYHFGYSENLIQPPRYHQSL